MNPNMPIKSRTRRTANIRVAQTDSDLSINHRHQPFSSPEHPRHYRLMEQPKHEQQQPSHETSEQSYVLDLSLKNKKNDSSDDVETRSISDDDVKTKSATSQLPHPLQSLLGGFNKPYYTSNDMTMFWNMLMQFSFNNYQNYFSQFKDTSNVNVDVLKGRY